MKEAPERIWASPANGRTSGSWNDAPFDHAIEAEYVRADKVQALVEAGKWLSNCVQTTGGFAGGYDDTLAEAIDQYDAAVAAFTEKGEKP